MLKRNDFVQYKNTPFVLLGQLIDIDGDSVRIILMDQPTRCYVNDQGIRIIEIPLLEGGDPLYCPTEYDSLALIERWDSSMLSEKK